MTVRQSLARHSFVRSAASLKITVACLLWLFVLTLWGTIAQVHEGLYQAQKTFFFSWFFMAGGFCPLPGAQLTLWILFVNLSAATIQRFVFRWSNIGILIIHLGLLSYFVAAFVVFVGTRESQVTLYEGESTNVSEAYHDWELAFWKTGGDSRQVFSYDLRHLKPGVNVKDPQFPAVFRLDTYYPNSDAFPDGTIKSLPVDPEVERNFPSVVMQLSWPGHEGSKMVLAGVHPDPVSVDIDGQLWNVSLRRARYPMPLTVTLDDFKAEFHPGTSVASSYESYVSVEHDGLKRDVRIYMNHPLRFKNYTFFQASYSIDGSGRERSTLAVVENPGRWLPYISSLITFAGLAIHFLMRAFKKRS